MADTTISTHVALSNVTEQLNKTRLENRRLIDALMWMCAQYLGCDKEDKDLMFHSFMSAGEQALDLLNHNGCADTEDDVYYKLNWDAYKKLMSADPCWKGSPKPKGDDMKNDFA